MNFSGKIFVLLFFKELQVYCDKVHFSKWIKTETGHPWNIYFFDTFLRIGIEDCIHECKARKMCRYINYSTNAHVCFLVAVSNTSQSFNPDGYIEKKARFILGRKLDWDVMEYEVCVDCQPQGECTKQEQPAEQYSICRASGCEPPDKKNFAFVSGNMFSPGNTIRYQCPGGYKNVANGTETAVCQDIGTWTSTDISCKFDAYGFQHCYMDSCYVLDHTNRTWSKAKLNCVSQGGLLISVNDIDEWQYIVGNLLPAAGHVWLGGNDPQQEEVFRWQDGTKVIYSNWAQGQPDGTDTLYCILVVNMPTALEYYWDDADCRKQALSICEFVRP